MAVLTERNRVLAWLGAILVVGFAAVASIAYFVSRDAIRAGISDQALPLTADNIYSEIQKDLLRPVFISSMMAHDTFVRDWILGGERDTGRIARYLAKIRDEYGVNNAFLVSERSRTHYLPQGVLKQVSAADTRDRWYFRVRQMKERHEINLDPDEFYRDRLTIFVNFRILDETGEYLGATGVGLTLDTIAKNIRRYEDTFHRRIYFVDKAGKIVLASSGASGAGGSIHDMPGIEMIAKQVLAGGELPNRLEYPGEKSLVLVNSRYIPELSSYLIVEQSEGGDIKDIKNAYLFNLALGLLLCLVVLAMAHIVVRRYQARIETMAQEALDGAARETERARSQQAFVSMVSHEFGTPLAIIDINLQNLKLDERSMPADVHARWRKIVRATFRLRELMENFLTNDRLQQADRALRMEPVDVFTLAARVASRAEWPAMEVAIDDLPAMVDGESELLRIVFFNLVNNAIKYSPEGGVIRVEGAREGAFAAVRVVDAGVGIPADELPYIFEKYYRAAKNKASGTGLGLHLVKQIVEMHGGTVSADSEPGRGTRFTVRLPLVD